MEGIKGLISTFSYHFKKKNINYFQFKSFFTTGYNDCNVTVCISVAIVILLLYYFFAIIGMECFASSTSDLQDCCQYVGLLYFLCSFLSLVILGCLYLLIIFNKKIM